MKKAFLTFVAASLISVAGMAQNFKDSKFFIDFGPKVMIGPSLMNTTSSSFDTTNGYQHKFNSFGYNFGFKFAFDFNQTVAIVGEYLVTNNTETFGVDGVTNQIKSKGYEIPLMLRINRETDTYIEAGIVLSSLKSVTENLNGTINDYTNLYNKNNTGLVFGTGGYIFGVGNWGVSSGLRFRYDFNNMVNSGNERTLGNEVYALDSRIDKTNNMSLMFVLEFNYDLGFSMANSSCGKSRKLLFTSGRR